VFCRQQARKARHPLLALRFDLRRLLDKRSKGDKVAIKRIGGVFDNNVDAKRTLREIMLLRHLKHENIIEIKARRSSAAQAATRAAHFVRGRVRACRRSNDARYECADADTDRT
jgi:hypothetical protein